MPGGRSARPAPSLLQLGPDLQAAILGRLPVIERWETLPLVCKAFQCLVSQPGSLWAALDIGLAEGPAGPGLAQTLTELRKRGRLTRELSVPEPRLKRKLEAFVGLLPPCFPALTSLQVGSCLAFKARDLQLVRSCCSAITALDIFLSAKEFEEAARVACSYTGLTRLVLSTGQCRSPTAQALNATLASLRPLGALRVLGLHVDATSWQDEVPEQLDWPADLCRCLSTVQALSLENCCGDLPRNLPEMRGLAALLIVPLPLEAGRAGALSVLAAVSSLRSLEMTVCGTGRGLLPACMRAPDLWLHLTSLRLSITSSSLGTQPGEPGRCIKLPRLQSADIQWGAFVRCLDYHSMTSLRSLAVVVYEPCYGAHAGLDVQALLECGDLTGLTSLVLTGGTPPLEELLLCAPGLRSLALHYPTVPRLPLCMASARLTSLSLKRVHELQLDAGAFHVLTSMSELQFLELCACHSPSSPSSQASLGFLRLISDTLGVCKGCKCHTVEYAEELCEGDRQQRAANPDESSDED